MDSPSCGVERVRVRNQAAGGRGLFAAALIAAFPLLPVEEEGGLKDPRRRDHWIERVFAYHRLQCLWAGHWRASDLARFHERHRLALLAHSPAAVASLGRLSARARSLGRRELRRRYSVGFMEALKRLATPAGHARALRRAFGCLREELDEVLRLEILGRIEDYRRGRAPWSVPWTLLAHYAGRLNVDRLKDQVYLHPHPKERALRHDANEV
jgi:uncharacterized protein YbgA (DUF1722 family)